MHYKLELRTLVLNCMVNCFVLSLPCFLFIAVLLSLHFITFLLFYWSCFTFVWSPWFCTCLSQLHTGIRNMHTHTLTQHIHAHHMHTHTTHTTHTHTHKHTHTYTHRHIPSSQQLSSHGSYSSFASEISPDQQSLTSKSGTLSQQENAHGF